jgi:hypothetical protein
MAPFGSFFPGVPFRTRSVTLTRPFLSLPEGTYDFEELYCDEPGCDCENVMLNVFDGARRHLATINHALAPGGAFGDGETPETLLDWLNPQSDLAADLLALFQQVVATPEYETRLRRHRSMVREKVDGRSNRARPDARRGR